MNAFSPPADRAIAREARRKAEQDFAAKEVTQPPSWKQGRAIGKEDLKGMQPPTDTQRKYIAQLGGKIGRDTTRAEASELINRLLAQQDAADSQEDANAECVGAPLAKALAEHEADGPGKIVLDVRIPARQPYEGKATMKQKDYLWNLGLKDQAVIDNLGKWQASALITQFEEERAKRRSSGAGVVFVTVIILIVIMVVIAKGR